MGKLFAVFHNKMKKPKVKIYKGAILDIVKKKCPAVSLTYVHPSYFTSINVLTVIINLFELHHHLQHNSSVTDEAF